MVDPPYTLKSQVTLTFEIHTVGTDSTLKRETCLVTFKVTRVGIGIEVTQTHESPLVTRLSTDSLHTCAATDRTHEDTKDCD